MLYKDSSSEHFLIQLFSPHSAWNEKMAIQMISKDKRELANMMQDTDSKHALSSSKGYMTSTMYKKVTTARKVTTGHVCTTSLCNRLTRNTTGSMPPFRAR